MDGASMPAISLRHGGTDYTTPFERLNQAFTATSSRRLPKRFGWRPRCPRRRARRVRAAGRVAVLDELVGQPELQHRDLHARRGQALQHRAAGAAHHAAFLDGDQGLVAARQLQHQGLVQRLDEAHVGHRAVQLLGRLQRRVQQRAEGQDRDPLAGAPQHAAAPGPSVERVIDVGTDTGAARVAHRHRVVLAEGGGQRLPAFVLVGRRQQAACSACSAGRRCRRRRRGWRRRRRPDRRGRARTPPAGSASRRRGSAGRSRAAGRWSRSPPPA